MPPFYDIYGLSQKRDKVTIEKFLNHFCYRDRIENREGQEIFIYKNAKYEVDEIDIPIKTLTEVIEYGISHPNYCFVFYIKDNLKADIRSVILKFTLDGKLIFGISIDIQDTYNRSNYDTANIIERQIAELTDSHKSAILIEYPPSDDEDGFDKIENNFKKGY